jgi:hypothetical protein
MNIIRRKSSNIAVQPVTKEKRNKRYKIFVGDDSFGRIEAKTRNQAAIYALEIIMRENPKDDVIFVLARRMRITYFSAKKLQDGAFVINRRIFCGMINV